MMFIALGACHAPPGLDFRTRDLAPSPRGPIVGINLHADRLPPAEETRQFDAVRTLGVGAVRLAVDWGRIEPARGRRDWTPIDHALGLAEERDIEVIEVLAYNAPWNAPGGDPMTRPMDLSAWSDWVHAAAVRYKGRIHAWEVWNEPNADTFLRGDYAAHPEARWTDYRDILAAARTELKAVDPTNIVVFGGIAHTSDDWDRDVEAYYEADAVRLADVLAIHPYVGADPNDPRWYPRYLDQVLRTMERHGDAARPVWVTEIGIPTDLHPLAVSEAVQAEWVDGLFRVALARPTIERVFWYDLQDEGGEAFGVLRADGSEKPAAARLRALAREYAAPP